MNFSTGPGGHLYGHNADGSYSIPENWADRRVSTLRELAQFLAPKAEAAAWYYRLLGLMVDGDAEDREPIIRAYPREWEALLCWQRMTPLVPATDAHGPTMRALLNALDESGVIQ